MPLKQQKLLCLTRDLQTVAPEPWGKGGTCPPTFPDGWARGGAPWKNV